MQAEECRDLQDENEVLRLELEKKASSEASSTDAISIISSLAGALGAGGLNFSPKKRAGPVLATKIAPRPTSLPGAFDLRPGREFPSPEQNIGQKLLNVPMQRFIVDDGGVTPSPDDFFSSEAMSRASPAMSPNKAASRSSGYAASANRIPGISRSTSSLCETLDRKRTEIADSNGGCEMSKVGMRINLSKEGKFTICEVAKGGSADASGSVSRNDELSKVDGRNVTGVHLTLEDVKGMFEGHPGTTVSITVVKHQTRQVLDVNLVRLGSPDEIKGLLQHSEYLEKVVESMKANLEKHAESHLAVMQSAGERNDELNTDIEAMAYQTAGVCATIRILSSEVAVAAWEAQLCLQDEMTLSDRLDAAVTELASIKAEIEDSASTVSELQKESMDERQEMKSSRKHTEESWKDSEHQLLQAKQQVAELEKQLSSEKKKGADLDAMCSSHQNRINGLEAALERERQASAASRSDSQRSTGVLLQGISELEEAIDMHVELEGRFESEVAILKTEVSSCLEKIDDLQERNGCLDWQVEDLSLKISGMSGVEEAIRLECQSLAEHSQHLKQERDDLANMVTGLTAELEKEKEIRRIADEKVDGVSRLESDASSLKIQLSRAREEMTEAHKRLEAMSSEIFAAHRESGGLKAEIDRAAKERAGEMERHRQIESEAQEKMAEMRKKLEAMSSEISSAQRESGELKAEIDRAAKERANEIEKQQQDATSMGLKMLQCQEEAAAASLETTEMLDKCRDLTSRLRSAEDERSQLRQSESRVREEMAEMQKRLETVSSELSAALRVRAVTDQQMKERADEMLQLRAEIDESSKTRAIMSSEVLSKAQDMIREISEVEQGLEGCRVQITYGENQVVRLTADLTMCKMDMQQARERSAALERESSRMIMELSDEIKHREDAVSQVKAISSDLSAALIRADAAEQKAQGLSSELATVRVTSKCLEEQFLMDREELEKTYAQIKGELDAQTSRCRHLQEQVESLSKQLSDSDSEREILSACLDKANMKALELSARLDQDQGLKEGMDEVAKWKSHALDLESDVALQKELAAVRERENKKIWGDMQIVRGELANATAKAEMLETRVDHLSKELASAYDEVEAVKGELRRISREEEDAALSARYSRVSNASIHGSLHGVLNHNPKWRNRDQVEVYDRADQNRTPQSRMSTDAKLSAHAHSTDPLRTSDLDIQHGPGAGRIGLHDSGGAAAAEIDDDEIERLGEKLGRARQEAGQARERLRRAM